MEPPGARPLACMSLLATVQWCRNLMVLSPRHGGDRDYVRFLTMIAVLRRTFAELIKLIQVTNRQKLARSVSWLKKVPYTENDGFNDPMTPVGNRPERPGSSARGRSVRKVRPVSVLGNRPGLLWTLPASLASTAQPPGTSCSASGG